MDQGDCSRSSRLLSRHLGLGLPLVTDTWERFEYLHALTNIAAHGRIGWVPYMRIEGLGASENDATAAVWFRAADSTVAPRLTAKDWMTVDDLRTAQIAFAIEFADYAKSADFALLSGASGFLPSSRHYPGRFDDDPMI